ncbi:MAG: electron transfer flavoprotein subunit alpha/FixB family protein, partial [Fusobacteriaceae bacterium]|nr:electron transfer flavoprotein subunit alpha/FixB family protein [Fusobacteriaceae bacterium]
MEIKETVGWQDILIVAQCGKEGLHPVTLELIGEAKKLGAKASYRVHVVAAGGPGTAKKAEKLLAYGVKNVYIYEEEALGDFRADIHAKVICDCIAKTKPSVVLIGATSLGRSLAPRLATRFRTGLTADCTALDIKENGELVQIRPAFGGNIMAKILISQCRPQFATIRYKVMDRAKMEGSVRGRLIRCELPAEALRSRIEILHTTPIPPAKSIEEEEILVVAGRGVKDEKGLRLVRELAEKLGGRVAYTRPMVEEGIGSADCQIGLSGRTVKPRLIITCGVSGAIQFTSCMRDAECIVAINSDPDALIFNIAHYYIVDDL